MRQNSQAFTLIELLVVVLIIGILSAVALPQYTRAVERSRAAEGLVLARAIADANRIYFMETGQWGDYTDLAIDIPGTPYALADNIHGIETKYFKCRTRTVAGGQQYAGLCNRRIDDSNSYSINIRTDGSMDCTYEGSIGTQICKVLTGKSTTDAQNRYSF